VRCGGEGAEVGGAGGVVGGVDAEVEVDGEEEVQLQRVELGEGEAGDLSPAADKGFRVSSNGWARGSNGVEAHQRVLRNATSSRYLAAVITATSSSRWSVREVSTNPG
jgi:hypothetical protein